LTATVIIRQENKTEKKKKKSFKKNTKGKTNKLTKQNKR